VERVTSPTQRPEAGIEPKATAISDVRSIPLETLQADAGARHMVSRILVRMDRPSQVKVAKFNSAI
jgi:hypothetical protein